MSATRPAALPCSLVAVALCILAAAALASCSPCYVMRAGLQEVEILLSRKDIKRLLSSPSMEDSLRDKFELALDLRDFAATNGLEPGGSFASYVELDRDVLVWVLSASPSTSLSPVTWWYPIVGRVPYKGFFDKEDATAERDRLTARGHDVFLRPSIAFSTLGWFDDPLLSTLTALDDVNFADLVLHELTHNTIWLPGHTSFNETLANMVGALGARNFFSEREGPEAEKTHIAQERLEQQLLYSDLLKDTSCRLREIYDKAGAGSARKLSSEEEKILIEKRQEIFTWAENRWAAVRQEKGLPQVSQPLRLNNAVILAQLVYLDRPELFLELYEKCDRSLPKFLVAILGIGKQARRDGSDPFGLLQKAVGLEREPILVTAD